METYNENYLNYYSSILDYLYQFGNLTLPSIGSWSIERSSAIIDEENRLHPAVVSLEFRKYSEENFDQQLSYFAELWQMSKLETHQVLLLFSANILKACSVNNSYSLPNLGEIIWKNNEIHFVSSLELEKSFNYYSEPLQLTSSFLKREKAVSDTQVSDEIEDNYVVLRPKYYKVIAASLLFAILSIVSLSLFFQDESKLVPVKFDIENTDYSADEFNRAPESDGSFHNTDHILEDFEIEQKLDEKEIVEERQSCTYILGSFSREYNVNRLQDVLDALSISTYKESIGGLIRVGATIECDDEESYKKLSQIESKLWLLEQ